MKWFKFNITINMFKGPNKGKYRFDEIKNKKNSINTVKMNATLSGVLKVQKQSKTTVFSLCTKFI